MGGLFGGGGGNVAVGTSPYLNGMGALEMQNAENQQGAYTEQGTFALEDAQMNAMEIANQAHHYREQQAVEQENAGVLNQGSPLLNLEYTRSQAVIQANQTLAAGQAQANQMYKSGLAALNEGRATLLGQQDQFISQSTEANIQAELARGNSMDSLLMGGANLAVNIASQLF